MCLLSFAVLLGFFLPSAHEVRAASGEIPEAGEAKEVGVELSDFLYVRNPIPGNSVEIDYRFERISERTESGRTVTRTNDVSLVLNVAPAEWLNLSLGIPYQFLTVHPADGSDATHANNFGDLTAEAFVMLLRDPSRQLAVSVGMDVGFPTGSVKDGTGGQWTLLPFVNAGIMLGAVQVLADVNFMAELHSLPGAGQPKRELLFNLGVGYPVGQWIMPFLTVNSAYAFSGPPAIRHRGQFYLSPGMRIGPAAVKGKVEPEMPPARANGAKDSDRPVVGEESWWKGFSLAVAPQFPLTAAREFEWGVMASLKLEF